MTDRRPDPGADPRANRRARLLQILRPIGWFAAVAAPIVAYYAYLFEGEASALRFARPWALGLLVAVPLVVWVWGYLEPRRTPRIAFSRGAELLRIPRGWGAALLPLPAAMRTVALALLAFALARPQSATLRGDAELEGIDIVLTLDLSNSMRGADISPTRLEGALNVIDTFIQRRRNDRIGVVIFGREAYTLCPPTLDYAALRSMLSEVQLGMIDGRGTAIGNAVGTAINRLRRSAARSRVIILLTDGDNNSGNIAPTQAAEFAANMRIKLYTVLMGESSETTEQVAIDLLRQPVFRPAVYPINPELLREMAENTGGAFYRATDRRALEQSIHAILDRLERSRLEDVGTLYAEVFPRFLLPALLLLGFEFALRLTRLRRVP